MIKRRLGFAGILLAGLILVLFWMVPYIYELFETMQSLFAL